MAGTVNVGTIEALLRARDQNYTSTLRNAEQATGSFQRQSAKALRGVTKLLAAGTAAAGAFSIASLKLATDINKSMANVATLIPGNIDRVRELRGEVQQLAIAHGKDTQDLAAGLYQTISAFGDDAADTVEILRINSEAAAAGLASTTDSINLTAGVTKAWGDTSAAAVQKAADLSLMTVRLGQTDFPALANSMGRVIPLAQSMGQTQEEMFTVFATATGVVGNAARVSTQYQGVLASLMKPTESLTALIEKQGVASGAALLQQEGFVGTLQLIKEEAERTGQPLTNYIQQIEAIPLALALAGPQAEVFNEKLREMQNAAGTSAEAFAEQANGINKAGFMFNQLKQTVIVLAQNIGEVLMPIAITLMQWVNDFITSRGGIPGLVAAFQQWLPKAIGFTLDAFILLSRAVRLLGQGWAHAIGGMAHLWDLFIAGINAGAAMALRAFNLMITGMRAVEDETEGMALGMDILQGNIAGMADTLDGAASTSMQNIRVRAKELSDGWDETWESQTRLEDGVNSFKDSITEQILSVVTLTDKTKDYDTTVNEATEATTEAAAAGEAATAVTIDYGKAVDTLFSNIRTGVPWLDSMISGFGKVLQTIGGEDGLLGGIKALGGAFKSLFGKGDGGEQVIDAVGAVDISGLVSGLGSSGGAEAVGESFFGAVGPEMFKVGGEVGAETATGFIGSLQSILGAVGPLMPIIGPLISAFGPLLVKGIGKLAGIVGGAIRRLFGGPSAAEIEGRKVAAGFRTGLEEGLSEGQRSEAAAAGFAGAASLIAVRDALMALGKPAAEAEAAMQRLFEAEKQGGDAVQKVIESLQPSLDKVQQAMDVTGLGMVELRDMAINTANIMGISVDEAFAKIAEGTITTLGEAHTAMTGIQNEAVATAQETVDAVSEITTSAARATVVTEEEKNAALETLMSTRISGVISGLSDQEAAELEAAKATLEVWQATNGQIAIGFADSTQKAEEQLRTLEDTATSSAGRVQAAFDNVDISIPVDFDVDTLKGLGGITAGPARSTSGIPVLGDGGIALKPTLALIGESGPEAVVPLSGSGSGGFGGPSVIVVQTVLDGEVVAENQVEVRKRLGID